MDRLNLTGFWTGSYWYYQPFQPAVPFIANLDENDGILSGTISEPNAITKSSDRLDAFVRGTREACSVEFAKVYDGASDAAHRIDYDGVLSDDGLVISGHWVLEDWTGGFRMSRQAVVDEDIEMAQEREVVVVSNSEGH